MRAVALCEDFGNPVFGGLTGHAVRHAHGNAAHIILSQHTAQNCGVRHPNIQAVTVAKRRGLRFAHADDAHRHITEHDDLSNRIGVGK